MAYESTLTTVTFPAAADLSAKQFYAVTIDSSGNVNVAAATKNCDGFLQNKPSVAGYAASVAIFGISKAAITASSNVAAGGLLEVDTAGTLKAVAGGTAVAKALQATNVSVVATIPVLMLKTNAVFA